MCLESIAICLNRIRNKDRFRDDMYLEEVNMCLEMLRLCLDVLGLCLESVNVCLDYLHVSRKCQYVS